MTGPEPTEKAEPKPAARKAASSAETSLPGRGVSPDERDPETTCPSCGRFAGTYERCPYCGAGIKVRLSVRVLRRISLAVAILGVFVIWWAARQMEIPFIKVGDFTPTHNFAILRVRGKIVSGPFFGDRGDSFYAGIEDGTGRINVRAYGQTAMDIHALDIARGDEVEARGSIRVQAGKPPAMSVAVARHLTLVQRAARGQETMPVPVEGLTRDMGLGKVKVRVRGRLERCYENNFGRGATLRDPTGAVTVWVFKSALESLGPAAALMKDGQGVTIEGRLSLYTNKKSGEETLQLVPDDRPGAIEATPDAPGGTAPAGASGAPRFRPRRKPPVASPTAPVPGARGGGEGTTPAPPVGPGSPVEPGDAGASGAGGATGGDPGVTSSPPPAATTAAPAPTPAPEPEPTAATTPEATPAPVPDPAPGPAPGDGREAGEG